MNANSSLPALTIDDWLRQATTRLNSADIPSARLDSLIMLETILGHERSWLLAHGEQELKARQLGRLNTLLNNRAQRQPLAYLLGHKMFYGRDFVVNANVLIPRPETETLIELTKEVLHHSSPASKKAWKLMDVGAGSGCIAITIALQAGAAREWRLDEPVEIIGGDISADALATARLNARRLGAAVRFIQSDLLERAPQQLDIIIANLPYVDPDWERSPETAYEPTIALFADRNGLALIEQLLSQAPHHLVANGYLLLEADPMQHPAIITAAKQHGLLLRDQQDYCLVFRLQPVA